VAPVDDYQQAAVAHAKGPAIVLAGPGSGTTRVIVERAVRLGVAELLERPTLAAEELGAEPRVPLALGE
jgi:hypothetical protein